MIDQRHRPFPYHGAKRNVVPPTTITLLGIAPTSSVGSIAYGLPDRRNNPNPMLVIDPTGQKDSTAGIQNFIDSVPNGSTIYVPGGWLLQVNDTVTLRDFTSKRLLTDATNPAIMFRSLTYPWRIFPDTSFPQGKQAAWLYDLQGGKANEPHTRVSAAAQFGPLYSLGNPHNQGHQAGGEQGGFAATDEYDTRFGHIAAATWSSPNGGTFTFTMERNHLLTVGDFVGIGGNVPTAYNRTSIRVDAVLSPTVFTVINVGTNPGPIQNDSNGNPQLGTAFRFGGPGGGGPNYDGFHITATDGQYPFTNADLFKAITVVVTTGTYDHYNRIIGALEDPNPADPTHFATVRWDASQGIATSHGNGSGNVNWAINSSTAAWKVEFTPNPGWNPGHFSGDSWDTWGDAWNGKSGQDGIHQRNQNPTVYVGWTCTLEGMEVIGANEGGNQTMLNWDVGYPVVQEFARAVLTAESDQNGLNIDRVPSTAVVKRCNIHNTWGSAERGGGQVIQARLASTGMQGSTAMHDHKLISGCIIEDNRHSPIDIEGSTGDHAIPMSGSSPNFARMTAAEIAWYNAQPTPKPTRIPNHNENVRITDNIIGDKAPIAWSSRIWGGDFSRNHSTQADINAGYITNRAGGLFAGSPGPTWSYDVTIDGNRFDLNTSPDPVITTGNVDRVTFRNNVANTTGYVVQPYYATNKSDRCQHITASGNMGGVSGEVAP